MGVLDSIVSGVGGLVAGGIQLYEGQQQRKQLDALQREQWARDDNSVQRRVADLKAAGLAPQLAAGGAPSSAPVAAAAGIEAEAEGASGGAKISADAIAAAMSQKADIARSSAQTALLKEQQRGEQIKNDSMAGLWLNPDGSVKTDSNGNPYNRQNIEDDARIQIKIAQRYGAEADAYLSEIAKQIQMKYGMQMADAQAVVQGVQAREMAASEPYFQPWMSRGSIGGAAMDAAKGLVPGGDSLLKLMKR